MKRSLSSGPEIHFNGLEMVTILKISMSSANHLEIEVVTFLLLYSPGILMLQC